MANYCASGRSNYFRVRDREAFAAAVRPLEVEIIEDEDGRVGLLSESEGGWNSGYLDENDEWIDRHVHEIVSDHLADDEVAIFMEAGAEKLRYVHGHAVAVNGKGKDRRVSLSDIYDLAEELGKEVTPCEY